MKGLRRFSAILIGFVFFIAGVLKLMDPIGAGLIVGEYLKFLHLGFLGFGAKFFGVALSLLETILGAALITGVFKKIVAVATVSLLGAFTLLTAILLIFNPTMDCGCFGEAMHLSHLQSFIKNLVLLALWALAFLPFSSHEPTRTVKKVSFAIASVSVIAFMLYSLLSIPLVDFTPYEIGERIWNQEDEIDFSEGTPLMLPFSDLEGNYADSLAFQGKSLVISTYKPESLSTKSWERIRELITGAKAFGIKGFVLSSDPSLTPEGIEGYSADRKTLMTLNRSNGGKTYLCDGEIVQKWSRIQSPTEEDLQTLSQRSAYELVIEKASHPRLALQGFLLYVFAVMLLL